MVEENISYQVQKISREKACRIEVFRQFCGNSGKIGYSFQPQKIAYTY